MTTPQGKTKRVGPPSNTPSSVTRRNKDNLTQKQSSKPGSSSGKRDLPSSGGSLPHIKKKKRSIENEDLCVTCTALCDVDSIECESCLKWQHRQCAGMSAEEYKVLDNSSSCIMFFCTLCRPKVSLALKFFNNIQENLTQLNSRLKTVEENLSMTFTDPNNKMSEPNGPSVQSPSQPAAQPSNSVHSDRPFNSVHSDRKFNLVLKGIKEPPGSSTRSEHTKHDFNEALSVLSNLDGDIHPMSVRDCFRLGRFKERSRYPRPILVKLTRSMDVHSILSQRSNLPEGVIIKPDMSMDERNSESLLLK